jgi:prophage regulatory protein
MSTIGRITSNTQEESQFNINDEIFVKLIVVQKKTGFSRSSIYKKISEGLFPKPIKFGPKSNRWKLSEVNTWIHNGLAAENEASK